MLHPELDEENIRQTKIIFSSENGVADFVNTQTERQTKKKGRRIKRKKGLKARWCAKPTFFDSSKYPKSVWQCENADAD